MCYLVDGKVLLTGDLDGIGLENLLEETGDIKSRVLVFPHHGGVPAGFVGEACASYIKHRCVSNLQQTLTVLGTLLALTLINSLLNVN